MQHIITTFPFLLTFSAFLAEGIEGLFLSALSLFGVRKPTFSWAALLEQLCLELPTFSWAAPTCRNVHPCRNVRRNYVFFLVFFSFSFSFSFRFLTEKRTLDFGLWTLDFGLWTWLWTPPQLLVQCSSDFSCGVMLRFQSRSQRDHRTQNTEHRSQNLEIYIKKRRLHVVPSCGSDCLKLHFREGSVAGISHIRKACAPREPWNVRWKRRLHSVPSCGSDRLKLHFLEGSVACAPRAT